ncbi:MAG: 4Fe-4S binding protein [Pseudomonadota bacterium]
MRIYRKISQGLFLLTFLFLFLQTESKGGDELGYPVKIFLDFDPLLFISTLLSSHAVSKGFYFSFTLLIATIILGRVFCGWVCPLGTLNNLVSSLKKVRPPAAHLNWHKVKYYIFIFLLAASLFTLQLTGILDPLSFLTRSLSLSIYPVFNYVIRAIFDTIYNINPHFIVNLSEFLYTIVKKSLLSFQQPFFQQALFLGFLFLLILGLNLVEKRFWCKYLCPLGALLGILSRYAFLKRSVSEGCDSCGACNLACQGDAAPDSKENWKNTECLYCMNCDDLCPHNAVSFGFIKKRAAASMDLGRRKVIASITTGVLAVPFFRITPLSRSSSLNPNLIRPPGSLEEKEFLKKCVRCGECMKVCITNGLQPTFLDAGLEGIWSPVLAPRIGHCEYRCTLCGQVCPTGAIEKLELEDKQKIKIGLAMIDRGRCLPYAHATPCLVCEEVCPTPKKAIWLEPATGKNRKGKEIILKQPKVDLDLCIGCGICEAKCPVIGEPAIYVINTGESRSKENQLLLL